MFSTAYTVFSGLLFTVQFGSAVELKADILMGGLRGEIHFSQNDLGDPINVTFDLMGVTLGTTYYWSIHQFPVNHDLAKPCHETALGQSIYDEISGTVTDNTQTRNITIGSPGVNLMGPTSLLGRSFLLKSNLESVPSACATILPLDSLTTAIVRFHSVIGGTVVIRQPTDMDFAETTVFANLFYVNDESGVGMYDWKILSTPADPSARGPSCENLGTVFNPSGTAGENCTADNHLNCAVGDLRAKLGKAVVGAEMSDHRMLWTDANLPLSGENNVNGKPVALFDDNGAVVACANVKAIRPKRAVAHFSVDGVSGRIAFAQASPFDPTSVTVDLAGLNAEAGGYHVHDFPVPPRIAVGDDLCSGGSVSGHWNPFAVNISTSPAPGNGTHDQYEVGDLSGKHGTLNDLREARANYTDWNLPLFGKNSIVGRSVVIHRSADGSRWVCTNIVGASVAVRTAVATFKYPVIGRMYFQQVADDPMADTTIFLDLNYADGSPASKGHNWHVHVEPAGGDFDADIPTRCSSADGHYNPFVVHLEGNYSSSCGPGNDIRCEVGDLSKKHGQLAVRTSEGSAVKRFFTDTSLPLSGPQSIVGRSVVIHTKDSGGSRLACANIRPLKPMEAAVTKWSAGTVSGYVTFHHVPMCSHTMVKVNLNGLGDKAGGYHVHLLPVLPGAQNPCSGDSVKGHFNPFRVNITRSPPAGTGTVDKYEVGDLSGKFGRLTGLQRLTGEFMDSNLQLRGPQSVVGRSVVIHREEKNARWVCGNIVETGASLQSGRTYRAKATFRGTVKGFIMLTQVRYVNGMLGDTQVYIHLRYPMNPSKQTLGHNWHIHEKPIAVGQSCASAEGHYNPYHVDVKNNYTECSGHNPLRCEVGDQASKHEAYDIGGGPRFYTDVDIPLVDRFSVMGRSFVLHAEGKGAARIACADILPMDAEVLEMTFPNPKPFDKLHFTEAIAGLIQIPRWMVGVEMKDPNVISEDCLTVKTYITGPDALTKRNKLSLYIVNEPDRLGQYKQCVASAPVLCWSLALLISTLSLQRWITN